MHQQNESICYKMNLQQHRYTLIIHKEMVMYIHFFFTRIVIYKLSHHWPVLYVCNIQ